jgi:hypothetical protein
MTNVRLSINSPQQVVIRRIKPEYQYLWFRFYCPSLFPGGNSRAHVHNAFGNGRSVDYSLPNECEDDNEDNKEEEDEEGGGGGGGCPRDQK